MRRLLLLALICGGLYADIDIEFKEGWQLVGVPERLDDMSAFDTKNVELVWGYDGATQSWKGFAPEGEIAQKLIEKEIPQLSTLEPWQALWVYSKSAWSLHVKSETLLTEAQNNAITLYEGWNLVQIPQNSVVSDSFFGDALVWKYSADAAWQVNDDTLGFPSVESIGVSEGLWVKSESTREIAVDDALSKLHTFESEAAMLSYIRTMLELHDYYYAVGYPELEYSGEVSAPTDAQDDITDATTTNLQEEGVDESDILKHDGTHIYSVDNSGEKIVVTTFEKIAAQDYTALTSIDMRDKNVVAMYLQNDRLSVVSSKTYYYAYSGISDTAEIMPYYGYATQHFTLDIFDVSDATNIALVKSYDIDGNYQESRLIDGKLYLISQFNPNIEYTYPKVYEDSVCTQLDQTQIYETCSYTASYNSEGTIECQSGTDTQAWKDNACYQYNYDENGAWKYDYDNPIVASENLIPSISSDGGAPLSLVTPSKFYAPAKLDQRANITTISRFDTQSAVREQSMSFLGDTHTYYASTGSLYLVSSQYPYYYDFFTYQSQQMIYKFALDENLSYKGRGFVEGTMLNQFSMSEKDDYLRVATTTGNTWSGNGTDNSVFTLKENGENLEVAGSLSGLGKENESIKAVRFMGDRGFVVTFRQTDPLYTLDMSDPLHPSVAGELSILGFSEYLHIIDENRVLSIGRDADESGRALALQVSLFDISDFANPQLADRVKMGDNSIHSYTYSEAEYNHKAFAYRASDLMFGIPYTDYLSGNYTEHFSVYQVDGMQINAVDTLSTSTQKDWGNSARGLIYDVGNTTQAALFKGSNILSKTIK